MNRAALVVALLASLPALVHAGRHGSDGSEVRDHRSDSGSTVRDHRSSSDSSTSSSSDSDSSSSSTITASESKPACIDDTDVVGFRKCTRFGVWGANLLFPRMFLELGTNTRQFSSGLGARTGSVWHGAEQFGFRTAMSPTGGHQDTAVTTMLRFGIGVGRGAYVGTELELGGLVSPAAATAETMTSGTLGAPRFEQKGGLVLGALGVAGYRVTARRGALAVEGAGGLRGVRYKFASTYDNVSESTTIGDTRGVVEARARAELWLGPWATLGATVGGSVVSKGDWMAGVYLGLHSRAFAGGR